MSIARLRGRVVAALAAAVLSGCATWSPESADLGPTCSGKLSVQVAASGDEPARNVTASFDLRGSAERGELQLTSPLGTVMAQARWRPGDVVLKTSDGEKRFADLADLADEVLGEPLPLGALADWLQGRPWAGAPSVALAPAGSGFRQAGWTVALDRWSEGWVTARRDAAPAVVVRARVER